MCTLPVLAASIVLQLLGGGQVVQAQTTQAVCTSAHSWMLNARGQSPCLVAAYLHLPCGGGQNTNVDAMTQPDQYYTANNDACQCNMVSYALFEACQNCQFDNGTTVTTFSRYSFNCTSQNVNKGYPESIPVGTAVPAWAYQDVSATDSFDLTVARGVAAEGQPDTSASIPAGSPTPSSVFSSASGTVADSPTTRVSGTASGSVTPSAGASSSSSHSIVGPVVGGVVGGVVGAIALGALLFYFIRRRSNRPTPHAEAQTVEVLPSSPAWPTPKSGVYEPWQTASPSAAPLLYNPEDPRTYPITTNGGPPSSLVTSATLVHPTDQPIRAYNGTAEL
ncbi:hypothetical protein L227DRAFT_573935 [Lentinus tigrinus ALCF2SS1-6]|uniref:Mid2 domain-containing protein n=2 Tax=Lentinus tigrinus TaxID=5365 RepID=A0A5C2SE90_9APHY|nr:hypothetical protein L227DRAFT_573935 [Lentinus tigrinus ALCF2SS1-6]